MITIDTTVVSEMMRPEPDMTVLAWADAVGMPHTTAITVAEVTYGIARLPDGRRRDRLTMLAAAMFADFGEVILPFDTDVAHQYAEVVAGRERGGRPIAMVDAQIAAIRASREATLATRNTRNFDGTGISVVDPWQ
ncbi:MAG: type II toxin-antitoxin system VapC family toxin [Allobranchiibius sp.]